VAGDQSTVQLLAPDPGAWWVKWSLPDSGFGLQGTANLANTNGWVSLTGPDSTNAPLLTFTSAGAKIVYVPTSALGSNQAAFYRLNQQIFTKLQVLMPGETNAPGTALGKTGIPTPQQVGAAVDVTVNALDNSGHIVNAVDTIHLTSSDSSATLPADAALAKGTATFSVTFNAAGSFTVTASDLTDPSKTAGIKRPPYSLARPWSAWRGRTSPMQAFSMTCCKRFTSLFGGASRDTMAGVLSGRGCIESLITRLLLMFSRELD
jgi:hypothetical protein